MANKTCKKCGMKLRKNNKKNKSKKTRKYRLYKVGGGCGCGNNDIKPWLGGNTPDHPVEDNTSGSKINLYTYNDHALDPTNPNFIVSSRNLPDISAPDGIVVTGGKKRRSSKSRRSKSRISKNRKMKGGDAFLGSNPNMPILSFGTSSGAYDFYKTINATNQVNPAPYVQPVLKMTSNMV